MTRLYFPADALQLKAVLNTIFNDPGLRFVFSTRSATPFILKENGEKLHGEGYIFTPGRDEIVRQGTAGYVVSYGEMLYRCLDAVEQLRAGGIDVGLINKTTLNVRDEAMLATVGTGPFALIVESQNTRTGLGVRYGTWLLERGYAPKYAALGTSRPGHGGLDEQLPHQGLAVADIKNRITTLIGA